MVAAAIEWMENRLTTLSRTCRAKSGGRRSDIRATALAADQRTRVSYRCAVSIQEDIIGCEPRDLVLKGFEEVLKNAFELIWYVEVVVGFRLRLVLDT